MFHDLILYTPMYVTLFWSITLLPTNGKNNLAKSFLGIFMFTAFIVYFSHAIFFKGETLLYLYIDPLYSFASLMLYPLYYVYIKILTVDLSFKLRDLKLFIPAIFISFSMAIVYWIMMPEERLEYINIFFDNKKSVLESNSILLKIQSFIYYLGRVIFGIQIFYFLIKGSKLIKRYNNHISNFYSNLEGRSIVWINMILWSFVITSVLSVVFNLIGKSYFYGVPSLLIIPSFVFSVLLYFIGFQGYMQNYTVKDFTEDKKKGILNKQIHSNKDQIKEQLVKLFENDKIYIKTDLKITDISSLLNTNRTYISNIINNDFEFSFNDYVNKYRVEEAQKLLKLDNTSTYTLEYISNKSGFGSLHSFIRIFKKNVGCTPGKYRLK